MTQPSAAPGSPVERSSDRSRLARVALEAALGVPGIIRAEAGVRAPRVTADASGLLVGVTAITQSDGRYAVDLRLVAQLVPLHPLADAVRAHVRDAASRADQAAVVGRVNVEFVDLLVAETAASASAGASASSGAPSRDVPDGGHAQPTALADPGSFAMIILARALVRLVSFLLLVLLAVAGLALAVFCIDTGTTGPSLGSLAKLLHLAAVRDAVGGWLGQLEATGPVAVIAALCGLGAVALGMLLLAGLLVPRRERLVTLAADNQGTLAARRRPLGQAAQALVEQVRGVSDAKVRVRARRTSGVWPHDRPARREGLPKHGQFAQRLPHGV